MREHSQANNSNVIRFPRLYNAAQSHSLTQPSLILAEYPYLPTRKLDLAEMETVEHTRTTRTRQHW